MAKSPRHHLVPQFLLRRFADAEKKLVMVKREDLGYSVTSTVGNACNEAGFYRIETDDIDPDHREGHDPEALEKALSVFEKRADRAIKSLLGGAPPWSIEKHYDLGMFTAFQYVRGWHLRKQFDEMGTLAMRREMLANRPRAEALAKRYLRERGEKVTSESVDEFINNAYGPDGPRLVMGQPHAIQVSFRFALETVAPRILTRPIRLLHFSEDAPLLTSDSPVATWSPNRPHDRVVALADATTITMPIAPNLALSFARGGQDAISRAGATRARQINMAVADIADRWIYHHPDTAPLEGLVIPPEKPRWHDEKLAARIDDDGTYRELWQTVQR